MKDGLSRWLSVVIAVIVLSLPCQASLAQTRPTSPEQVAREFYVWYLQAGFPSPKRKNLSTFRKYVTQRLIKKQMDPEVDSDLLLGDVQDFDKTWKVDSVSKATILGQRATTLVIFKGKEWNYRVRVTLRRENGSWKIDDVKNALASTSARSRKRLSDRKRYLAAFKTHADLLDPPGWMAGSRRYRSGFCTEVLVDFILGAT